MNAPIALAFASGMVAAINPCGFALLPAYLTYFVGLESGADEKNETGNPVIRALVVSLTLTAGFVVVFGLFGIAWAQISSTIGSKLPWVTVVLGIIIAIGGLLMLFGVEAVIPLPKIAAGDRNNELGSIFLYGIGYAVASLSCTIGIFVALVTTTFESESFFAGLAAFVSYALGMGTIIAILTVAVSLARVGIVNVMRRMLPYMGRISGALMIISGLFVAYYGWWEIQVLNNNDVSDGLAGAAGGLQGDLQTWINNVGATTIAVWSVSIIVVLVAASLFVSRSRQSS